MLSRILPLSLVAALALAVGAVAAADKTTTADKPAADNAVTGTVNAVADGKLTVSQKDGKDNVLSVAKDAEITLNGKKAELTDLKKGQSVTVTTAKNKDGDLVAAKVEATGSNSKDQPDANTHSGVIVSAADGKLVMTGKSGKEHTHVVANDAKVTCDGKDCKLADLKKGETVIVTIEKQGDATVATKIEATSADKNDK